MHPKLVLAIQHRTAERFDQARCLLEELYAEQPEDAQVNYHYAWLHDRLGEEIAAVPFYERAIGLGLPDDDLRSALLGLGSTYRCIGEYQKAAKLLREGLARFPEAQEIAVFLAMALYNLGEHREAMEILLRAVARASSDLGIQRYHRAIEFYADKLDKTWS
jgi:tetratricopeptide (TPR) repeat protein